MKKVFFSLLLILCTVCLPATGCSGSTPNDPANEPPADPPMETPATYESPEPIEAIDVNLSELSDTLVFAEVTNMFASPDYYMGKTVKIRGAYYSEYFDEVDQYFHYVVVGDATSCCQQGMEFIWNGTHTYPNDYPQDGSTIEVTGVFGEREFLGSMYLCLWVDEVSSTAL